MPRVSHNHRGGVQHFQASGRTNPAKGTLHRFPVQRRSAQLRLHRRERQRCILGLKFPIQGQVNIPVDSRRRANIYDLPPDCRDSPQHREIIPLITQGHVLGMSSVTNDRESLIGLFRHHRHSLGTHDPRFFPRNVGQSPAQPLFVFQADRPDDRRVRIDDIGSVPASAHTDLDHRHIHRHICEQGVCHDGHDLKERQPVSGVSVFPQRQLGFHVLISLDKLFGGDGGLVH